MYQSKIDTIKANLENTMEMTTKEIERLEDYKEETYWYIRDIEDRIFDIEHGYFDEPVYDHKAVHRDYLKALADLDEQKDLYEIICDELAAMKQALKRIDEALDVMAGI